MSSNEQVKAHTQQRFGDYAQGYVQSQSHAHGFDLEHLLELAQPQPDWLMLDVATGGGHTTLKFAPHIGKVIASDLTPRMLDAARKFISASNIENVAFSGADAENLPFASETFDFVTCRIAPHHFPDCYRFIQECARVLKVGGALLVEDHVLPDSKRAGEYIDAFERLRDPSHHRGFAEYEWRGMFLDAGLSIESSEIVSKSVGKLIAWAKLQDCTPEIIERLQVMLVQAPQKVADWIRPQYASTPDATFDHNYIIIMGRK